MKDIKPNQEGLMSPAEKRPDVVEKMGYDPDSFAAGGIAMLEAGRPWPDGNPDMATEKQGIQGFFWNMANKENYVRKDKSLSKVSYDKIRMIDEKDLDKFSRVPSAFQIFRSRH